MVFVDRTRVVAPAILTNPNERGPKETLKAIAHFTGPNSGEKFNFSVYSDPVVKDALIKLFYGKCAYCESLFAHVYSGDVEHFRPKLEITEAVNPKPGYYWLASEWNNLLLSCRNCNQKLAHLIYGKTSKRTMGKMNQFPLSDETRRVRLHDSPNGIDDEEPFRLLLNPCIDDPEDHLLYDIVTGVILPKRTGGIESVKGKASIEVYVLQRVALVLSREKLLIDIHAQIQRVKEAVINYNSHVLDLDTTKKFYFEKILKRELGRLKQFINPEEQYVAMAKQVIGEFLKVNFGISA
jgi:uncharacterized protein (TIGR02646 family)